MNSAAAIQVEPTYYVKYKDNFGVFFKFILYMLMIVYAASFYYNSSVSRMLMDFKWIFLIALLAYLVTYSIRNNFILINATSLSILTGLLFSALISSMITPYGSASLSELAGFAIMLLNALMLVSMIHARRAMDHFLTIVLNVGLLVIAVSFAMALAGINLGRGGQRFSGWSDNPNSLAMIISPALVILFARVLERRSGWKYKYLPFLLAGLYVIYVTDSRGSIGWVAVSLATFFLTRLTSNTLLVIFSCVFISFLFLIFGETFISNISPFLIRENITLNDSQFDALFSGRTEAWRIGMQSVSEYPFFGIGVGNEVRLLSGYSSLFVMHNGEHAHSSYISATVEIGFIGATFIALAILLAVSRGFQRARLIKQYRLINWPSAVLPLALLIGALAHGAVETWFLKPGNPNTLLFWVLVVYNISKMKQNKFLLRR